MTSKSEGKRDGAGYESSQQKWIGRRHGPRDAHKKSNLISGQAEGGVVDLKGYCKWLNDYSYFSEKNVCN
jgi:hypothetical protein